MTIDEFKEYIDSIGNTEEFKEIADFIKLSDYAGENLAEKIMSYLSIYHNTSPFGKVQESDLEYFRNLFKSYEIKKYSPTYTYDGFIDLDKDYFLVQGSCYSRNIGFFTEGYYLFPNRIQFISKKPVHCTDEKGLYDDTAVYIPVIVSGIAKEIGVNSAEYILGKNIFGNKKILSKNFLDKGEELNTFYTTEDSDKKAKSYEICAKTNKISEVLDILERSLVLRNFPEEEIKQARFDFLKQEFFAKLVGLVDQSPENTGIITSVDDNGQRHVRLAPAFDFDYSFLISSRLPVRCADNGQSDIASLIKQYKDYPGFMEFVKTALQSFSMDKVYETIYADTGLIFFKNHKRKSKLKKYTDFVNKNIELAKETVASLEDKERNEDKSFESPPFGEFC